MSYLNPPYPNNFQELCAAMPLYYLDVFEMRAILRAQGYLLDGVCSGMEKLVDVNFILTADETTIRQWEKALKITRDEILTLEQRKRIVISYIIGFGHIGEPEIREIISLYTDFKFALSFDKGNITISMDGIGFVPGYSSLMDTICRRIPAHLSLKFVVTIRSPTAPKLRIGGSVGLQPSISVPQEPDTYDFRNTLHTGGTVEAAASINTPQRPDDYDFQSALHTGGSVESVASVDSPAGKDYYDFQNTLHMGGKFSGRTLVQVQEDTEQPPVSFDLRTGGKLSNEAVLSVPENVAPPPATTILRTGGVCTIISNSPPKGE